MNTTTGFIDSCFDQQRYDDLVAEAEIAATETDPNMSDKEREQFIERFVELRR